MMTTQYLKRYPAYRGDSYAFKLTFPTGFDLAAEIASGPSLAQIRSEPDSTVIVATWDLDPHTAAIPPYINVSITGAVTATLTPANYVVDVQIGATTWLKNQTWVLYPDVSRPVVP